jgi:glutamate carboxypeptidase
MPEIRRLAAALDAALPALLDLAERTVNTDSGTHHAPGVDAVSTLWAERLGALGFALERTPLPGFGAQVTARLAPGGNGPRLLLLGHADTVWPAGTVAGWPFARDGEWLSGPGVGDMKTNVAMALHALSVLRAEGALGGLSALTVCIVPDEEIGSPGSRAWLEAEARQADLCLTLEPCRPGGGVVIGRGAVGAVYVRAEGVTAHCGAARELGASALAALAALVAPVEALGDPSAGLSATVGILRGGDARQVVPGWAEMHIDLRAPDDAAAEALLAALHALLARPPADPRVRLAVQGGFTRPAFPTHAGTRALLARAEALGAALGAPVFGLVSRGGSDGSFAARLGVPTLDGLGPVTHEVCSRRERVELASIAPRAAILAGLIAAAAEGSLGL